MRVLSAAIDWSSPESKAGCQPPPAPDPGLHARHHNFDFQHATNWRVTAVLKSSRVRIQEGACIMPCSAHPWLIDTMPFEDHCCSGPVTSKAEKACQHSSWANKRELVLGLCQRLEGSLACRGHSESKMPDQQQSPFSKLPLQR